MGKGSNTTTTQQQQTYNPAGGPQIQSALTQAQNAAQLPFNIPQAPVAGFSQDQQSAFGNINNAQGMAQPYINQAQQYFSPQGAQQFFNPYADAVTAQMQNIFGQQNQQNTANLTQAAGGVGADRIAVGQGNLANQQGLAAGQTYANLYGQAAQQAQSAGYGTAALGSQAQNAALQGSQAQLASGGLQQQLQQAQLNSPYQQQLAQSAFPYQQAQFLAGITGSLAPGLGGTTTGQGTTTGPSPSLLSQILGLGTAGVGAAGGMGAFSGSGKGSSGGVGSYGQGSNATGYGAGTGGISFPMFARGGGIGFDEGGATSSPFDLPPNFNDKPINVAEHSIIPTVQTPAIRPEVPKLNLNPPAQQQQSGGGLGQMLSAGLKLGALFAARGGRINNPYADGGAAFGTLSPGEEAERPPNILDNAVSSGIDSLATLPRRAIEASAQDVQHLGDPDYQRQSIGPALETAMTMTGGAGAIPAEANSLRAGLKLPTGYYDKVPMDMRMSRKGVSHPGLRWEVYDSKTGEVVRKDLTTRSGASMAQDRLDNKYGGYKYQVRPTQAKELTESEAQFLKDKGISFDPEAGMARGGRTKNPYGFADGGTPMEDAQWPVGPIGGPSDVINPDEPYRMPEAAAVADWRRGADVSMADGTSATSFKPAFPPPAGSHGRSVGAPAPVAAPDAAEELSGPSTAAVTPSQSTPAGKSDRFIDSPWAALMAAGLGIAGGTSPFAAVNIGQGGLQGLKTLQEQRSSGQKDETIAQATRRLDLEAKHHEDQFTRMTPYQQIEALKPVQVGQDDYGRPIMAKRNPKSGEYEIIKPPVMPPPIAPGEAPAAPAAPAATTINATGDTVLPQNATVTQGLLPSGILASDTTSTAPMLPSADVNANALSGLKEADANKVRAIAEGRAKFLPMTRNNAYNRYIMDKVMEYNPNADEGSYSRRSRTQNFFAVGTAGGGGQNIAAMNTFGQHADELLRLSKELNLGQFTTWNQATNWMASHGYGDKEIQDKLGQWQVASKAVADEGAKVFAGSNSALADREAWQTAFDASNPASVTQAKLQQVVRLVEGRLNSLVGQYNDGMRTNHAPAEFIRPRTREVFDRINKNEPAGAPATPPAAAAPAAAPAAPQVGERKQFKQGWGVWNGKSWDPAP